MPIDPNAVVYCEFGVALLAASDTHYHVPITPGVKAALLDMLKVTLNALGNSTDWEPFDCADQHASTACLQCSTNDPIAVKLKNLYMAQNVSTAAAALDNPSNIDYYFARFRDNYGNECVAVHKASVFKAAIGKNFMVWLVDQLTIVEKDLFRLDTDFDFLVFSDQIAIYRPIQFERIADLESELIKIAPSHIQTVAATVTDLDFGFANELVKTSSRARKLFASLKARNDLSGLSSDRIMHTCQANGIDIIQKDGKWTPAPKHELAFLEMLDRRRYNDPLVEVQPSAYRAAARKKVV